MSRKTLVLWSVLLLPVGTKVTAQAETETLEGKKSARPETKKLAPVVRLISAGQDPKAALRLKVAKGQKQFVSMTMDMEMKMSLKAGFPLPQQKLPGQKLSLGVTVSNVEASGDLTFETAILGAGVVPTEGVHPQISATMERMVRSLAGLRGSVVLSSRGIVKSYKFEGTEKLDAMTRQALAGMEDSLTAVAIPLPEEAVGVGAKWSVTRVVESQGIEQTRVDTYELVQLAEGSGVVKTTMEQSAKPQEVKSANSAAQGMKQRVVKMKTTGTGETRFDLTKILPKASTLKSRTDAEIETEFAGQKQEMTMEMTASQKTAEVPAPKSGTSTSSKAPTTGQTQTQ